MKYFADIPLVFRKLENRFGSYSAKDVESLDILDFLHGVDEIFNMTAFVERYKATIVADGHVHYLPLHPELLQTISNPLKFAKVNFLIGNYLGTISQIGMLSEMLVLFMFRMAKSMFEAGTWPQELDKKDINTFEGMTQKQRISLLYRTKIINQGTKDALIKIAEKRNKYLHTYITDTSMLENDAIEMYSIGVKLFLITVGQRVDGSLLDGFEKGATVTVHACNEIVFDYLLLVDQSNSGM